MSEPSAEALRRLMVMGAPLDVGTLQSTARELVSMAADASQRAMVLHRDANGVVQRLRNPDVATAEARATHVLPDGIPMCWLAKFCGFKTERLYGPDLMRATCQESVNSATPIRHAVAGGAPGIAEQLAESMREDYPGIEVVPIPLPMIEQPSEIDPALVAQVNDLKPDILWIGLGCPKQDLWMAAYREHLEVPVMVGNGAAFNFLSGNIKQAPAWIRRSGFEWLFRSIAEPRVAKRNLFVVPYFLVAALFWICRHRSSIRAQRATARSYTSQVPT